MTATCAWCDRDLGANQLLPEYPIGRRLAFDPATARIWAVCPKCERWNLSFLDEPERRSAAQRLDGFLAATPHRTDANDLTFGEVGETQLIRVGATGWRSFAGWRYGRTLHRRYRNWLIFAPIWTAFLVYLNIPAGDELLDKTWVLLLFLVGLHVVIHFERKHRRFTVPAEDGSQWLVESPESLKVAVEIDGDRWTLRVPTHADHIRLEGAAAFEALRRALTLTNFRGGSPAKVRRAVELILSQGDPARFLATTFSSAGLGNGVHRIARLGELFIVALEIAVNEMSEQRALDDDLTLARLAHTDANHIAEALES